MGSERGARGAWRFGRLLGVPSEAELDDPVWWQGRIIGQSKSAPKDDRQLDLFDWAADNFNPRSRFNPRSQESGQHHSTKIRGKDNQWR